MSTAPHLRIGEVSRRTGVSVDLLRAWEKRYGVLSPGRSEGGFRLYSEDDVERVRAMQVHLGQGLAAAQAARLALESEVRVVSSGSADLVSRDRAELEEALALFAEVRANAAFDRLLATLTLDALLTDVLLPYLHDLGDAWERGDVTVAQEHFASNIIRGRLLGLARGWGAGVGPHALLACPPGELHDLGLIAFGLALRSRGWRITFLGQDTPIPSVQEHVRVLQPDSVVLAAAEAGPLNDSLPELRELAAGVPVSLAGAGATASLAREAGATLLSGDPIAEAQRLTNGRAPGSPKTAPGSPKT
jgi:MerR family transcriptional regulator, light-induced transcriptional regulator